MKTKILKSRAFLVVTTLIIFTSFGSVPTNHSRNPTKTGVDDIYSNDFGALNPLRYSDVNLKENIETIPSSLNKITQLRPVTFNYKQEKIENLQVIIDSLVVDQGISVSEAQAQLGIKPGEPAKTEIGFIAQEVQLLFPDVVSLDPEGTLFMDYVALIPLLVKAIQEQQQHIEQLETQVSSLASK